jgi:threonine/homoserine/homoserine lactone efflux protein
VRWSSRGSGDDVPAVRGRARRLTTPYTQGIVSNLANPTMVVFFLSLLPPYAGAHGSLAALLGVGLVFCTLTFLWLTAYAAAAARIGDVLDAGRLRTALKRITATVLVALGLRLATERV